MKRRNPLPPVKIRLPRKPKPILPSPHKPRADTGDQPEMLEGMVQDKKASAPEERLAKALNKLPSVDGFNFRQTFGAPRGLPGWFECDFIVSARGMVYAIEVDSEFTHRQKSGRSDVLHDAKVLRALERQGHQVYPSVIHWNMETELVDQKWADTTAKRAFS
jgi:hypothetical protein